MLPLPKEFVGLPTIDMTRQTFKGTLARQGNPSRQRPGHCAEHVRRAVQFSANKVVDWSLVTEAVKNALTLPSAFPPSGCSFTNRAALAYFSPGNQPSFLIRPRRYSICPAWRVLQLMTLARRMLNVGKG